MYKTVRHGENSLQYTILPQTEEVLTNSGMKGKGRDYSPSIHVSRSKKRSTTKYILLVIFGVFIALALASVPLYVMNTAILSRGPGTLDRVTIPVATVGGAVLGRENIMKSRKKELRMSEMSTLQSELTSTTRLSSTQQTPSTSGYEKRTKPAWSMPAFKLFWTSTTTALPTTLPPIPIVEDKDELNLANGPFSRLRQGTDDLTMNDISHRPWSDKDVIIRPTVNPEPTTVQNVYNYVTKVKDVVSEKPTTVAKGTTFDDVLITTKSSNAFTQTTDDHFDYNGKMYPLGKDIKDMKDTILDDEDEFKELVDQVFTMPPLDRESKDELVDDILDCGVKNEDDVKVSKTTSKKLRNLWPFDPSSLFQWPDYSREDSMIMPLLIGTITLILLAVVMMVVVVRRRKDQAKGAQHIGKLTADLQEDDNTNLLTAENPEDE